MNSVVVKTSGVAISQTHARAYGLVVREIDCRAASYSSLYGYRLRGNLANSASAFGEPGETDGRGGGRGTKAWPGNTRTDGRIYEYNHRGKVHARGELRARNYELGRTTGI